MTTVLAFATLLFIAVLISGPAQRSVISTAVLFLLAGVVLGDGGFKLISVQPRQPFIAQFTELALFAVLFSDGMRFDVRAIREIWRLPSRALVFGLPLTLFGTALLARWLIGLSWLEALLIGAVLSPTDPVFATAIVSRDEVPSRVRRLLNVESGLNDGLALPAVVLLLNLFGAGEQTALSTLGELAIGLGIGVAVPWTAVHLTRRLFLPPVGVYRPLNAFSIGLLVLALARLLHGNLFFAAFSAGITITTICPTVKDAFMEFGETVAELLKLGVLLIFGALISFLTDISWQGYLFAVLAIVLVRPLALWGVLLWSGLSWRERAVTAWFGPKGFASIFYGLLVLRQDVPAANELFHLAALTILLSIIAHSSTDVVLARWVKGADQPPEPVPQE